VPFLIALAVAALLTPALASLGGRIGLVDRPGDLKIHQRDVPVTGGVGVVVAVLAAMWLSDHRQPWLAGATVLALAGGLDDDLRAASPWLRLVVQTVAAALLVAGGLRLEPLGTLGGVGLLVATVAMCNAVNMLDGQDGLAGGLAGIAGLGLAGILAATGRSGAVPLALGGAAFGFALWNRPPARVFLGDGGAYAIGVLLAASAASASSAGWSGLLAAGACLGVFVNEVVATVVRRLRSSSPTVRGDRDHSYDRLARRLGSRTASTAVMWIAGAACAVAGVGIVRLGFIGSLLTVALLAAIVAVLDVRLLPLSATKGEP